MTIKLRMDEFRIYPDSKNFETDDFEILTRILNGYALVEWKHIKDNWTNCISVKADGCNKTLYVVLFEISKEFKFDIE